MNNICPKMIIYYIKSDIFPCKFKRLKSSFQLLLSNELFLDCSAHKKKFQISKQKRKKALKDFPYSIFSFFFLKKTSDGFMNSSQKEKCSIQIISFTDSN